MRQRRLRHRLKRLWFLCRLLLIPTLCLIPNVGAAGVVPVAELVEERAMAELGAAVPPNARIDVRMTEGALQEGAFLREFWIDPNSGQFIANAVSAQGVTHRVSGIALTTVRVPVPLRRLMPDDIITSDDITHVDLPIQRLGAFAIQETDVLVGQQVRRMLAVGRPVPRHSVMPPLIIARGEKVKIVLERGGLSLTSTGRAMADAHEGQALRVVNLSSNKTISAVAIARGTVEVLQ